MTSLSPIYCPSSEELPEFQEKGPRPSITPFSELPPREGRRLNTLAVACSRLHGAAGVSVHGTIF